MVLPATLTLLFGRESCGEAIFPIFSGFYLSSGKFHGISPNKIEHDKAEFLTGSFTVNSFKAYTVQR